MPSNIKINRSYGRKNVQLLRLAIQSVMLFILLLIVIFIGLNVIFTAQDNSKNEKVNLEKKYTSEKLDEIQKTYEEFVSKYMWKNFWKMQVCL
jgi:type III secretory pathway component EscR